MTTKANKYNYRAVSIPASQLIIPRETYQRDYFSPRTKEIAAAFDERLANEPKVSYRDGKYYVFDGQHTIGARVLVSGDKIFPSSARCITECPNRKKPCSLHSRTASLLLCLPVLV